jgi:hypothetical protein
MANGGIEGNINKRELIGKAEGKEDKEISREG